VPTRINCIENGRGSWQISSSFTTGTVLGQNRPVLFGNNLFINNGIFGKDANILGGSGMMLGAPNSAGNAGGINFLGSVDTNDATVTITQLMTIAQGTGNVGINQPSPTAKLHALTTAAVVGQIIQLAAAQTADALQVQDSAGTVLMDVDAAGVVQASGYKSSDGSAGWTGTFTGGGGETVTVKNGLITSVV
jgi:hypothetical protein